MPIAPPKTKASQFSGGFVFHWQTAYFGLELPVPVVLVPLLVEPVLFLWCRRCFLVVVVLVVLWSPVLACPEDAELPLVPLWSAEPLACAKLNEAVSSSANAIVNSFFTLFLSSEVIRDKTE